MHSMEPLFPFQWPSQTSIRVSSHFTSIPSPYGAGTACAFAGYFVRHLPLYSVLPQARGLRLQFSSWCTWLSHAPTTTPHPPLLEASGFRWGLPYLLPTPLHILQEASRVHRGGLQQNAVGGVLLNAPSPLWGSPIFLQGRVRLTWSPMRSHPMEEAWVPALPQPRIAGSTG
jgi:hypothetical protein